MTHPNPSHPRTLAEELRAASCWMISPVGEDSIGPDLVLRAAAALEAKDEALRQLLRGPSIWNAHSKPCRTRDCIVCAGRHALAFGDVEDLARKAAAEADGEITSCAHANVIDDIEGQPARCADCGKVVS
jgi:hypothetical protein